MHFTGVYYFFVSFLYLINIVSVISPTLAVQGFETIKRGRCQVGRKDIINLVDTVRKCFDMCKKRPVCKAYSFHRLAGLCRLHTEQGTPKVCVGFSYSEKKNWDMTDLDGCACTEGEVCVSEGSDNSAFDCPIKECVMPNNPSNGQIHGNLVSVGRHIRYLCNKGYIPKGTLTRVCQQNGTWSGIEPHCDHVCPRVGSLQWGTSCYFIVTSSALKKTFADADSYCKETGGHLIRVTSQEEHDFISSRLATPDNPQIWRYWVGVTRGEMGEWYLSDNTTIAEFFAWGDVEPKSTNDCAVFKYIPVEKVWKWYTVSCATDNMLPVCEYDIAL